MKEGDGTEIYFVILGLFRQKMSLEKNIKEMQPRVCLRVRTCVCVSVRVFLCTSITEGFLCLNLYH